MTQDVRIATVISRLVSARKSLFLANELIGEEDDPHARWPTDREIALIAEELEQVLKLSNKIARFLDVGPTCPICNRLLSDNAPSKAPCRLMHNKVRPT